MMRNIGLFTPTRVERHVLAQFVLGLTEQRRWPFEERGGDLVIGTIPDLAFIAKDTSLRNGCFDEEERADLRAMLGFDPVSYIDLHFSSTDDAYRLSLAAATEMQHRWQAVIDFSGTGGQIGIPPPRSERGSNLAQ